MATTDTELPPPPPVQPGDALLLDFDGTLVAFALTPDAIEVSPRLRPMLETLRGRLDGALAFITGRAIDDLDGHLSQGFDIVGAHGAEWRIAGERGQGEGQSFEEAMAAAHDFAARRQGVLVQPKSGGFTLHFRSAPEHEADAKALMDEAFAGRDDFEVMAGAYIWEARRRGDDKGAAVQRLMDHAPFAGRRPVFAGDDVTDEDAHREVVRRGGIAIKVGDGPTGGNHRLPDIDAVHEWLARSAGLVA